MAGVAGLEPVTSAVTGQRSNQLSYTPAKGHEKVEKSPPPSQWEPEFPQKRFGQQTPRRWGWGTPLKKRTATRTKLKSLFLFTLKPVKFLSTHSEFPRYMLRSRRRPPRFMSWSRHAIALECASPLALFTSQVRKVCSLVRPHRPQSCKELQHSKTLRVRITNIPTISRQSLKQKKELKLSIQLFKKDLATTYSRGTYRTTTIGKAAFDGRVRDGIGSGHSFMVTKKSCEDQQIREDFRSWGTV